MSAAGFGPWAANLDAAERLARWRAMRALAFMLCGPAHPLVAALRDAERDPLAAARLEALPALRRRRVLATYAELVRVARRDVTVST